MNANLVLIIVERWDFFLNVQNQVLSIFHAYCMHFRSVLPAQLRKNVTRRIYLYDLYSDLRIYIYIYGIGYAISDFKH